MSRKVLLATMHVGGGHTALRDSFAQALTQVDPRHERFEPVSRDSTDTRISGFYEFVVHHIPRFQQTVYDLSNFNLGVRAVSLAYPNIVREARELLEEIRPDAIISTHLILSIMFARARRQLGMSMPLVSAIPDYGATTRGFFPEQDDLRGDYCIVMDRATRQDLIEQRGFDPAIIHHSGFLTRAPFSPRPAADKRLALWQQLKAAHPQLAELDPSRPTFIFLGGSAWTSKTMPVLERLISRPELSQRLNAIIVCGKNPEFESELKAKLAGSPNFAVFGFVSAQLMANLQQISDYPVLGSLAPASMQELLETRCGPLLLFHFIRGTEGPHVQHIIDNQIGLYEPDPEEMIERIRELLGLSPPSAPLAQLVRGFPARAAEIRRENKERALKLGDFLERIMGPQAAGSPEAFLPPAAARPEQRAIS